ncbi:rhomboid family intramembrane serine protease [Stigmatella sp. ncwal1]|uniref:Rhomboid family intramembrane serine protease n=1 Tax=Stigmatella ashevillensis TaxID=2995309 RepID=A0ABT5D536_9BACT|nr:rhomboid family intramembrane serine protease [Stigmatella ashevillena]MDC0708776.1 rhomboid family intramembrane serine protease [Stigmatella ashevillena]
MARKPRILDAPNPSQPTAPEPPPRRWTPVCSAVLALSVVMFFLDGFLLRQGLIPGGEWLERSGKPLALFGPLIQQGQPWRVLTYAFEHGGPIHLLFNMSAAFTLGPSLERAIGSWRFLGLSLVTCVGSAAFALLFDFDQPTVGASGMILGWLGALLPIAPGYTRRQLGLWLLQIALISLIPGVSWAGHLGGVLFGLPCGLALKMGKAVYARALPLLLFIAAVVAVYAAYPERHGGF